MWQLNRSNLYCSFCFSFLLIQDIAVIECYLVQMHLIFRYICILSHPILHSSRLSVYFQHLDHLFLFACPLHLLEHIRLSSN